MAPKRTPDRRGTLRANAGYATESMSQSDTSEIVAPAKTVAAIDIGANSLRMVIAEVLPDGQVEVLEQLQQVARLGQDTFRRGRLNGEVMRAAAAILRDYRRILDLYDVKQIRAVATSAVREASNAYTFLDRLFMATGLDVEVIDTSEESRLAVSAVRNALEGVADAVRGRTLIADVGGGSTLLTVLEEGEIAASQSLQLGSLRLQEALATGYESPDRSTEILTQQIANVVSSLQNSLPLKGVRTFVAIGSEARFAARQVGRPTGSQHLHVVTRGKFERLVAECQGRSAEELSRHFGLPYVDAETLSPALLVYRELLHVAHAKRMTVSDVSMRDGLLLDMARSVTGREDKSIAKGVIRSAIALSGKYHIDLPHAKHVARLAVGLFDELQAEHGLSSRHRLLLEVAGLVHEVGGFVSSRAHHKHSFYLIANSEIFGLTREELMITAHVSRYHRRGLPKPSHLEYMSLPRETRTVIAKLSAMLRVADALDRGHAGHVSRLWCERQGEEFVVNVPGVVDLTLERRAMGFKGDLFDEIYGMRVRLEEVPTPAADEKRAWAVE
jgi:exopolyphosphatase / guanosine-5'-triphosphate,3'-diphosphate pyrophosphatase